MNPMLLIYCPLLLIRKSEIKITRGYLSTFFPMAGDISKYQKLPVKTKAIPE